MVGVCPAGFEDKALALIDETFFRSKGRSGSFRASYPCVFGPDNPRPLYATMEGNVALSALAFRRFLWDAADREIVGAMIGAVTTRPEARGHGLSSCLLAAAEENLRREGVEIIWLWTTIPDFYRRLGWTGLDDCITWCVESIASCVAGPDYLRDETPEAWRRIEERRRARDASGLHRNAASYSTLPIPATRLAVAFSPAGDYALWGENKEEAYLYEWSASVSPPSSLLQSLIAERRRILVNGFATTLAPAPGGRRHFRMWKKLQPLEDGIVEGMRIPYLDRI